MARSTLLRTVVFRLVAALVFGGLGISAGLSVLELHNAETLLRINVSQNVALTVRNIQAVLGDTLNGRSRQEVREIITAMTSDRQIRAARLSGEGFKPLDMGDWNTPGAGNAERWRFAEHSLARGDEVSMRRLTLVWAPFLHQDHGMLLELLVDGPAARQEVQQGVVGQMRAQWLLLSVMTLLGLLLIRRWVTGPLSRVMQLIGAHAGPAPFYELAKSKRDEFSRLAEAIGGMLTRLECTTDQLRSRERACQNLYQFAPAAMVSLDSHGKLLEGNNRAAVLLGAGNERNLRGQAILEYIRSEDRSLLRQTIDRLNLDPAARCDLRVLSGDKTIDVSVECAGVRDEEGNLQSVHLSLLDVSESKQLHRQLADKGHLLNLVLDHIPAAVLLIDSQGRIAAHNQQLAGLVQCQPHVLTGQVYDPSRFWDELGVANYELFVGRLRQIDADHHRPAQERFETRAGVFLFQGVPVQDASGKPVGRLWVVQDITQQEQSQRLLQQQANQLQALKKLGPQLSDVADRDLLMERVCKQLFDVFGVEAIGLAIRREEQGSRSIQILHRGPGAYLLETNRALIQAVERQLMPQAMANQDAALWPELMPALPWAKAFTQAGLTCLAVAPLRTGTDAQGILWIARRGGERLERHHLFLLEALAPVIASRIEITQLRERLNGLELTDAVTGLPNARCFDFETRKMVNRPGRPWSIVMLNIDHFRQLNELVDHAAADKILARVAAQIQAGTRKGCTVARLGGPAFAVLLPDGGRELAVVLAERLRNMIAQETVSLPGGETRTLSASIGAACCPADSDQKNDLMDLARARMELARRSGRNRVVADGPGADKLAG